MLTAGLSPLTPDSAGLHRVPVKKTNAASPFHGVNVVENLVLMCESCLLVGVPVWCTAYMKTTASLSPQ